MYELETDCYHIACTEAVGTVADALQVLQQLDQAKHVPDFNNYLSFIFSKGDNLPLEVREATLSPAQHSAAQWGFRL